MPFSRGSPQPRDQTRISYVSCISRGFFTTSTIWEAQIENIKGTKDLLESLTVIHSNVLIESFYICCRNDMIICECSKDGGFE